MWMTGVNWTKLWDIRAAAYPLFPGTSVKSAWEMMGRREQKPSFLGNIQAREGGKSR